jgi:putative colanic acid biosynthesis UDP-glucose lipid carrier transferase
MTINDIPLISFFQRVLDPLTVMVALYLSYLVSGSVFDGYALILMILAFFISSAVYQYIDPYRAWRSGRVFAFVRDVFVGWAVAAAMLVLVGRLSGLTSHYDARAVLLWFVATPLLLVFLQLAVRGLRGLLGADSEVRSVVIVGANSISVRFAKSIEQHPNMFMQLEGYFDDREAERWPEGLQHPMLGKTDDLAAYVRSHQTKMIFISLPMSAQPRIRKLLDELQDTTASVYFLPDIYVFDLVQARFDNVNGMPVIAVCESPFTGINSAIKRISDLVLASVIQVCLLPIMLIIALAVKLTSPGPVIF